VRPKQRDTTHPRKKLQTVSGYQLIVIEDGSDAKDMGIHDAVGSQKDNDMIETEDVQMTDTEELERVDRTQDLGREKMKVTRTGIVNISHGYDVTKGDGKTLSGTQNEELETEETQLEGMYATEAMPAMQMCTVRTKKLKTDRDEAATKIRNRNKTRTRNVNSKGTQSWLPLTKHACPISIAY